MYRWPGGRKRALLAAMLWPVPLVLAGLVATASIFGTNGPGLVGTVAIAAMASGYLVAFACAVACIVDATRGGRVERGASRGAWVAALLLTPAAAAPSYWWLHVRPGPAQPHGLPALRPASEWSRRVKTMTGVATAVVALLIVAWMGWVSWYFLDGGGDPLIVPMMSAFGVWTVISSAVLTLLVLDALREGGTHAGIWVTLLVFAWAIAAPLYWWLYVRPAEPPHSSARLH